MSWPLNSPQSSVEPSIEAASDQRPRVLFLLDTLEVGGAEQSILQMASRLRAVEPVVCHVYKGTALKAEYERAGIRVLGLEVQGRYGFIAGIRRFRRVLKHERPSVVHVTLFRAAIVARVACAVESVALVDSFVNDPYSQERWRRLSTLRAAKLAIVKLLDRLTVGAVKHFVANSAAVASSNAAALRVPTDSITVIHRGRDPELLQPPRAEWLRSLREELALPVGSPIVLNVGRLLIRKGQLELLRAFRSVSEYHPGALLLIAGEGPDRSLLEREVARLQLTANVRLPGTRDDVPHLLHLATVFAFPSHYEGFGGALVEAMLSGCPIVGSDIPVNREAIVSGRTGLLVPLGDETALANAISTLLTDRDQASRLGSAARTDALERFTVSRAAELHEELYLRLLGGRAHATHSA